MQCRTATAFPCVARFMRDEHVDAGGIANVPSIVRHEPPPSDKAASEWQAVRLRKSARLPCWVSTTARQPHAGSYGHRLSAFRRKASTSLRDCSVTVGFEYIR